MYNEIILLQKRGYFKMPIETNENEDISDSAEKKKRLNSLLSHPLFIAIVAAAIPTFMIWLGGLFTLPNTVNDLSTKTTALIERVEKLEGTVFSDNSNYNNTSESGDIYQINGDNTTIYVTPSISKGFSDRLDVENITADNIICLSKPEVDSDTIIGKDTNGNAVRFKELISEKLVISYMYDGKDIFFQGQFNENSQWDGECILNIYNDGILESITEANYDNGNLLNYKQLFKDIARSTNGNIDVWKISNRVNEGAYNSGETWSYFNNVNGVDVKMVFNPDEIAYSDILTISSFKSKFNLSLEGYYHGNTSGGYYNDNTGNAYLVKYFNDETVRTLYQGNFENGTFNDDTGNAWYITKEIDTEYMYYKGYFKDGHPQKKKDFKNPFSLEDIKEFLQNKSFNCTLEWSNSVS